MDRQTSNRGKKSSPHVIITSSPSPSTDAPSKPKPPDEKFEKITVSEKVKKKTPPEKNRRRTAVDVGKSVSDALKDNFARTMATVFTNYIIALTDQNYKLDVEKKKLSVLEEEKGESENEEAYSTTKRSKKDLIDDIVEGKNTFGGTGKRRAMPPKSCCPTKISLWLSSAEDAFKTFANFIITLETSSEGKKTLESLYREDVRKTVEAVMYRQNLFDNASPVAKGLARFDTYINLLSSNRISVLDSSIEIEIDATRQDNILDTLNTFKDETKELLCPRVTGLLKHLSPNSAASVFTDVVKYVEKSFSFYKSWGDLPGTEFRILLADVNIKIMEKAVSTSKSASEDVFGPASSSALAALNLSEEDTRTMINALQKIREWKPVSKDHPSRIDKARDVVLIPETGNIGRIPVTPTDLLQLVSYINALLSLERRNVFTNGFFNAACVLISQCLLSNPSNTSGNLIRPSKLAAKMAKNDLFSLHVMKEKNRKKKKEEDEEEPMSVDEESSSSSSSFSEDEKEKEKQRQRKKKMKKLKSGSSNEEEATALSYLMYITGGFFHDTSEFGEKIKSLINLKNYVGLINYASSLIDSGSKIAVQRLVASLIDIIILKTEQYDEMKKSYSCPYEKKNAAITVESKTEIVKMLLDPQANKNEMVRYFLNVAEPSVVPKHEAYVLTERLLSSDNNSDIGTVTLSFFRKEKIKKEEEGTCHELDNLPNLFKFLKELVGEIAKITVSVLNKAVSESPNQTMSVGDFLNFFSPLGSKLNVLARIKSAVIVKGDEKSPRILFSPEEEMNKMTGLRIVSLIDMVIKSPQMKDIRQNASDLHDPDNAALSMMLFPPSSKEDNDDEIIVLSKLAKGLFSIAEESIAVVRSRDFDESGEVSSYALVLDVDTMNKAVKFAASSLENATGKALFANEDMRPSRVLDGASFVEGALSYILDRRENINTVSDKCSKPTALAKYTMTDVTDRYLKRLNQYEKKALGSEHNNTDPAVAREEAASDRALIEEVTNRATDIVNAQMANAMGMAIIMSAAIKILEADVEEAEERSMNNQTTSPKDYHGTRANVANRIGVIKSLAHLCITTAAAAASNMSKLSNQHFFSVIKEANATMTKKKSAAANEVTESEDYRDKEMKKAMLLGYTNKPEEFYLYKHGNDGNGSDGSGGKKGVTSFRNWLYNAIDSITERRNGKNNNNNNSATASSKYLLFDDLNNKRWDKETQESIMDKLNKMV